MSLAQCQWFALAALAFVFPSAALADISGTPTLASNTALNLDTGLTAASGGDLLWNGTTLAPQGKAKAALYGNYGASVYAVISATGLSSFSVIASSSPVAAKNLVAGEIIIVFTNGGNTAKMLVTANSNGSITLEFTTFITPAPTGPTITSVLNNSSVIPAGLPNSGIAPSSIFVIIGTGLADSGAPVLQSSAAPGLPTSLNGASITVTVNNVVTHPPIYYTSPTQIAAVLPANTPIGAGAVTVTYKNVVSAPAKVQVVATALGINTYNGNTGVATDANTWALLTLTNSGKPGEVITLWTTGLGADPADSDSTYTLTPHAVNTPLQIYIGGVLADTALYQGSAGYPGVNQINVTIPTTAPSGCWVSLGAVAGGVVSNLATLPIAPNGGECTDAQTGLTGSQIAPAGGQTLRTGLVSILQGDSTNSSGKETITTSTDAAFEKYTGIYTPSNQVSPGGCIVTDLTPVTVGDITGLDPGVITLAGPSGGPVTLASQFGIQGAFYAVLAAGSIPKTGGSYTFQGTGGADVGAFTATVTFANPILTWTNAAAAAAIDRTKGLAVTWTGGNPGSFVAITGTSSASGAVVGGYTCLAKAEAGQFTVPSYILSALPAGKGGTDVINIINSPLTASGLDIGLAGGEITFSVASTYN